MSEMQTSVTIEDGKVHVASVQDCSDILANVSALRQVDAVGSNEMRHAAQIPMVIVERYLERAKITFAEFMHNKEHIRAMLNDPALAAFRIWPGKV